MKPAARASKKQLASSMLVSSKLISSQSKTGAPSEVNLARRESRYVSGDIGEGEQDEAWMQPKVLLKPSDQLELSEQELKEEHTRMLTANNPRAPSNPIRFSFKDSTFKAVTQVDNVAVLFHLDTNLLHRDSDEGKRQLERNGTASTNDTGSEGTEEGPKIMNQFNYSERAAQTQNQPPKDRETMTDPPPRLNFSGSVSQWEIHDAYVEDIKQQQLSKEKSKTTKFQVKDEPKKRGMSTMDEIESDELQKVSGGLSILERMVNQNTYDDISQDFKYWEDAGDEFRAGQGSLLPLWKLSYEKARKFSVTSLKWNSRYKDFLAVGYGSHSFMNDKGGLLCFYTLKNPSFPEYIFSAESGVSALDNNPSDFNLVAVGLYSGNVAVYDLTQPKEDNPVYRSTAFTGKHSDPVWQVAWQKPDPDGFLNFYSISSDGVIKVWTLMKNELQYGEIIQLRVEGQRLVGPSGVETELLGCGTCFDFCKKIDYIFLVGTEEGRVHKCSKTYINQYLDTAHAHNMTIYSLKINPIHPSVFLTCSADWTVKVWNHAELEVGPLFTFDLNSPVADATWAPYASTVFAACTIDGFVYVYDLSINKYAPLCKQQILQGKKGKLTRLVFNPHFPVLIVADDRGTLFSFKLSPNLRKVEMEKGRSEETEMAKMDKLIAFILEPLLVKQRQSSVATAIEVHS